MPSFKASSSFLFTCFVLVIVLPSFCHAFGAGNIAGVSKVEGVNWRHGDIEDTLLTILLSRAAGGKKFSKMDVKRVYFGNWLRDYSQAVDVGTVKSVSAEAIRIVLWVLGFLSFGYGTREFEVTRDRLGCYRPEEHIDNPKDYADNQDARQYDRRLRGPVDERRELAIDPSTGLKMYIASEQAGITTSAGLVRDLFGRSIHLGRQYARTRNEDDLYEALRLLGTGCHCLEDYSAHSNFVELSLIELGERDIFPHVGRNCQIQLPGARNRVYPIITGTFGGVDFLHSVMGEFSDKATQSEMQELEGAISDSESKGNVSIVKELLDKLPPGLIGGDQAGKADELQANSAAAKMNNMHISPREPEAWTRQLQEVTKQIYPVLEFHDQIMKGITETVEKIPILPTLIEEIQDQISIFVFSLLAPYVLPIIRQIKTELSTGSSEIIQSSNDKQLNTFYNDSEDNPTHSMLSKDHFSNVLNEPAGKVASQVLKWVVPQLIACWDDERIDPNRTINRIIAGVFHHPAQRQGGEDGAADGRGLMFQTVEQWWREKSDRERDGLRGQLSRDGVQQGRNHKEGVHDSGHGCGKPIALKGMSGLGSSAGILGAVGSAMGGNSSNLGGAGGQAMHEVGNVASDAVGGGALGGLVGGLVGGVGASLLGNAFGGSKDEHKTYASEGYSSQGGGGYTSSITETAHHRPQQSGDDDRYGQAEYKRTSYQSGGRREEYSRYEQDGSSGQTGYGFQQSVEQRPQYGGGYEQTTESRFERPGGEYESHVQRDRYDGDGRRQSREQEKHHGHKKNDSRDENNSDSNDEDDYEKKQRKREKKARKEQEKREKEARKYGGGQDDDSYGDYNRENQLRNSGGYGGGRDEGRREDYGSRNDEYSGRSEGYEQRGGYEERSGGYESRNEYSERSEGYGGGGYERQERGGYEQEQRGGDYEQQGGYGGGFEQRDEGRGYGGGDNDDGERRGYGDNY